MALKQHVAAATATKRSLAIAEAELDATIAARAGEKTRGYGLFRKAAEMEAALLYTEPPSYPRPVVEGFAATASALGDHTVAEEAWREALAREPGSGRAYFGLAAALSALQRPDDAQRMMANAMKAWDKADRDLPQLRRAAPTAGERP